MTTIIREMTAADTPIWQHMRHALWPFTTPEEDSRDIAAILANADSWGFLASKDGTPVGFAEVSLRRYANGCEYSPVPFLEGIWVAPSHRRGGIGAQIVAHLEAFLRAKGFREICSDVPLDNTGSRAAHTGWGFAEPERVVYYRKPLS